MTDFRWGILSTGAIARTFAEGLAVLPGAVVQAVGSRRGESAEAFAREVGAATAHASYAALAADPDVDAIYIATPHTEHFANTVLCLEHGKPVLCEKPIGVHVGQARAMVECARQRDVFLMEAMWTQCNPVWREVFAHVANGAIGEPRMLQVDFGFRTEFDPGSRLFDPALGGGALLDVGVYCLWLAHSLFDAPPQELTGLAHLGSTGVDEQSAWVGRWPGGELAVMSSAVRTNTPQEAIITGTEGRIRVPDFWRATGYTIGSTEHAVEVQGNGYHYEAAEVMRCVAAGQRESELVPLDRSLAVMASMDRLREQWGLRYPADSDAAS